MSTIIDALATAQTIAGKVGADRIRSMDVSVWSDTSQNVSFHPKDAADGESIATALGLSLAQTHSNFRTWDGDVDGAGVTVFGAPPVRPQVVIIDADTGEALTGPLDACIGDDVVAATSDRRLRVKAVSR